MATSTDNHAHSASHVTSLTVDAILQVFAVVLFFLTLYPAWMVIAPSVSLNTGHLIAGLFPPIFILIFHIIGIKVPKARSIINLFISCLCIVLLARFALSCIEFRPSRQFHIHADVITFDQAAITPLTTMRLDYQLVTQDILFHRADMTTWHGNPIAIDYLRYQLKSHGVIINMRTDNAEKIERLPSTETTISVIVPTYTPEFCSEVLRRNSAFVRAAVRLSDTLPDALSSCPLYASDGKSLYRFAVQAPFTK